MKAIIVGGGIGGLTTALMLHARGIDCEIFEQADTFRELGVGINTLPHAIKELAQLGLLPRLDEELSWLLGSAATGVLPSRSARPRSHRRYGRPASTLKVSST